MNNSLKHLIKSAAWKTIEEMFANEITATRDPSRVDQNLDDKTYAREVRARIIAANRLASLLNKIKIGGVQPTKVLPKNFK